MKTISTFLSVIMYLFITGFEHAQIKQANTNSFDPIIAKLKEATNSLKKILTEFTPEQKAQLKEMQKQYEQEVNLFQEKVRKNFQGTAEEIAKPSTKSDARDRISTAREKIDIADKDLIEAISKRMQAVKEISALKKSSDISSLQADCWKKVLENAKRQGARQGLSEKFIEQLMNAVHEESLRLYGGSSGR